MDLSGILGHVFAVFSFFGTVQQPILVSLQQPRLSKYGSATNTAFASATTAQQPQSSSLQQPRLATTALQPKQHCTWFHFLNLPPKALHAMLVLTSQPCHSKSSCQDSNLFFKPPPKALHAIVVLSCSLAFPSVFVTTPGYFLNLPPKALHAIVVLTLQPCLSKSSYHDFKSFLNIPSPKPYIQWHSSIIIFVLLRVLMAIPSHLNLPKALHALVVAEHGVWHSFPCSLICFPGCR